MIFVRQRKPKLALVAVVLAAIGAAVWTISRSEEPLAAEARPHDGEIALKSDARDPTNERAPSNALEAPEGEPSIARDAKSSASTNEVAPEISPREALLASFAGERPDVHGLLDWSERFAHDAEVDPTSVKRDPKTGVISGELEAKALGVRAKFSISSGRYDVSIDESAGLASEPALLLRMTRWTFRDGGGIAESAASTVQFHPDTRRAPSELVEADHERIVGWTLEATSDGARARPIAARAGATPGAWVIGRSDRSEPTSWPGLVSTKAHDQLLSKLSKLP